MLTVDGLCCGYGRMQAVHDLSFSVEKGRVLALLGANGAGKSSTIMCIAGHVRAQQGRILFEDEEISAKTPMERVAAGIAVVPEGRRLFSGLTVRENLVVGGYSRPKTDFSRNADRVMELFPRLKDRMGQAAGSLSGGEQQMLSLGRALMAQPKLLLIDELSLGLMPKMVDACYLAVAGLKKTGQTIVLVEQNTQRALEVADMMVVLESGRAVLQKGADEAAKDPKVIDALLGMGEKS